jgi:hypothetical protein
MEGLTASALPYKERHHNGFAPRGQTEDFCPVVVTGLRAEGAMIRDAYNELGVPCIVIDYGYLSRVSGKATFQTGHWQVGVDRLGWVPKFACPSDRFDALGIELLKQPRQGKRIYVCGQHDGDPSHGLSRKGIIEWAMTTINDLRFVTEREIVWRAHPDSQIGIGNVENSTGPIDWGDVHCIVTINSNIGHEALINGVPVICDPGAPYAELANDCFSEGLFMPDAKLRKKYFSRLAYGQWTLEELRSGLPQRWLVENGLTEKRN